MLLFVIRDHIGATPLANLAATLQADMQKIWDALAKVLLISLQFNATNNNNTNDSPKVLETRSSQTTLTSPLPPFPTNSSNPTSSRKTWSNYAHDSRTAPRKTSSLNPRITNVSQPMAWRITWKAYGYVNLIHLMCNAFIMYIVAFPGHFFDMRYLGIEPWKTRPFHTTRCAWFSRDFILPCGLTAYLRIG
jgi:hypothetical protein